MSTVQEIKAAIPKLTLEERAEVARCLHVWEDDEWEVQIKADLASGKLARLLARVDADIADENLAELPRSPSPARISGRVSTPSRRKRNGRRAKDSNSGVRMPSVPSFISNR